MKKRRIILLLVVWLLSLNVCAKDTVYSRNKNENEKFFFIKESYNKESKSNGFVLLGSFQEEEETTILVRYNKSGNIKWTYQKEKSSPRALEYSYEENQVDGYIIALENDKSNTLLQKVDLDGNLIWEKDYNMENLQKILISYSSNGEMDGYLLIGERNNTGVLLKIDKENNIVFEKEVPKEENSIIKNIDITYQKEEDKVVGYSLLREINTEEKNIQLILLNLDLEESVLEEHLEKYDSYQLESSRNGFILYGMTSDVKVSGGDRSYYLMHYNENQEIDWETLGDTPTDKNKKIVLLRVDEKNDYFLFYTNENDSSYEVIRIKEDGEIEKKVKKINNEYYDIESFYMKDNILYLIGQIDCPEDDNCEYDNRSLFLVSDEDTVIEVTEKDNGKVITISVVFVMILGITILIHKKRKMKKV